MLQGSVAPERGDGLGAVLRPAEEGDLAVGEPPPVLHVHARRLAGGLDREGPVDGGDHVGLVRGHADDLELGHVEGGGDVLEEPGDFGLAALGPYQGTAVPAASAAQSTSSATSARTP